MTELETAQLMADYRMAVERSLRYQKTVDAVEAAMDYIKEWAAEPCDCFEFVPTGKDAVGVYGETTGKSGSCLSCQMRAIMFSTGRQFE